MPHVSGNTLVVAIQAVEARLVDLQKTLETHALPEGERGDLEELSLSYDNAAAELKRAYGEARAQASNLPPYEDLVRGEA